MNYLSDVITYIRRIVKTPSDAVISDNLIIDYINRFMINDMDLIAQLFDFKSSYQFQTTPGVDRYNAPLYSLQTEQGAQQIGMYPIYQGYINSCRINGIPITLSTQSNSFFSSFPNVVQQLQAVAVGNGTAGPYTLQFPILGTSSTPQNPPFNALLRGHVDITGIVATGNNIDPPVSSTINTSIPSTSIFPAVYLTSIDATGANVVVSDSGQFLTGNVNYGLLMEPGAAPYGNTALSGGYSIASNTINYLTGACTVTFPVAIPAGNNINAQVYYFQSGLPRAALFANNILTLRTVPAISYLVEIEAYLSPAAFLSSGQAVQFGYMSEYIARGAARKILSDVGDTEQFAFYEPLFKEQRDLVWKRSQRQFTTNRTETLYSRGHGHGNSNLNGQMGGALT